MRHESPRIPTSSLEAAVAATPAAAESWPGRRLGRALVVAVVAVGTVGCAGNRIPDGPPLQLHRTQFTYNSPAKQPVYDWFALDPAFVAVVEQHPPALAEARKAGPYRTASWIGVVGWSAFMIKSVFTALDDANSSAFDDELWTTDYTIAAGFAVGTIVFDAFARRYLNRAVSLFNANATRADDRATTGESPSDGSPFRLEFAPVYRPGTGAGLVGRIPIR